MQLSALGKTVSALYVYCNRAVSQMTQAEVNGESRLGSWVR